MSTKVTKRTTTNFSNFKFILYVSYATPEEAIGRDLCLGLKTIVQTMKRDNFEYYERFSQITTQVSPHKRSPYDNREGVLRSLSPSPELKGSNKFINQIQAGSFMIGRTTSITKI